MTKKTTETIASVMKVFKAKNGVGKAEKNKTLDDIAHRIKRVKEENGGKVPRNFISSIVNEQRNVCPWISRDVINYHYKLWNKSASSKGGESFHSEPSGINRGDGVEIDDSDTVVAEVDDSTMSSPNHDDLDLTYTNRNKGGRPKVEIVMLRTMQVYSTLNAIESQDPVLTKRHIRRATTLHAEDQKGSNLNLISSLMECTANDSPNMCKFFDKLRFYCEDEV